MTSVLVRFARHPRRLQLVLDLAFLLLAIATFGQVWDPDILFHGIWVMLTLNAFLFGLRAAVARIAIAMFLLLAYFFVDATLDAGGAGLATLDLAEWPLMILIATLVAVMADRVATASRLYAGLYRRASERLVTAQEDERKRLGRDLHDGVGQTLTAMVLTLDAAESQLWATEHAPAAAGIAAIRRAQELAAIALDETREVSFRLRPDRFIETGLVAAVRRLAATAGKPITVMADPALTTVGLLDPEDEMNLYRIIQEALANAVGHAHAKQVSIAFSTNGGALTVEIADDGVGFHVERTSGRGLGLHGMRERALILRGNLEIRSRRRRGSKVTMTVPLPDRTRPVPAVAAAPIVQGQASR